MQGVLPHGLPGLAGQPPQGHRDAYGVPGRGFWRPQLVLHESMLPRRVAGPQLVPQAGYRRTSGAGRYLSVWVCRQHGAWPQNSARGLDPLGTVSARCGPGHLQPQQRQRLSLRGLNWSRQVGPGQEGPTIPTQRSRCCPCHLVLGLARALHPRWCWLCCAEPRPFATMRTAAAATAPGAGRAAAAPPQGPRRALLPPRRHV